MESCTANALCTAWRYAQARVDPGFTPSRLFLYYNERKVEGKEHQDAGVFIGHGCRSLATFGVCSEQTWPYEKRNELIHPPQYAYDEATQHVIHSPTQIPENIDHLKYSLAEHKPFVVGIELYPGFHSDNTRETGYVPMPLPGRVSTGGHAVLCVGYDDSRGVWIFRNSWGLSWGDHG